MTCISHARKKLKGINLNGQVIIDKEDEWCHPPVSWVKVNVDGTFSSESGVGCGGIRRNNEGAFITGFRFHEREGDSLTAEVWADLLRLKLAWDSGAHRIILETDATKVVRLLRDEVDSCHPDFACISEAKTIMERDWVVLLQHVPMSANRVADVLAKQALNNTFGLHSMFSPGGDVGSLIDSECHNPIDAS